MYYFDKQGKEIKFMSVRKKLIKYQLFMCNVFLDSAYKRHYLKMRRILIPPVKLKINVLFIRILWF